MKLRLGGELIKPSWKETLKFLAGMVEKEELAELLGTLSEGYFEKMDHYNNHAAYNPHLKCISFGGELLAETEEKIVAGENDKTDQFLLCYLDFTDACSDTRYSTMYHLLEDHFVESKILSIIFNSDLKQDWKMKLWSSVDGLVYTFGMYHYLDELELDEEGIDSLKEYVKKQETDLGVILEGDDG